MKANKVRTLIESKNTKRITFYNNYSFETFLLNHIKNLLNLSLEKKNMMCI